MTAPEPTPRERLDRLLLGDRPQLTAEQVAAAAGVSTDVARRIWRALGFPDAGDQVAFSATDLEALCAVIESVRHSEIDLDTAVALTRAAGRTMARLADWQVATLASRVEQIEAGPTATGSRITTSLRIADEIADPFENLLVYAWRRHLAGALGRIEALAEAEEGLHTVQVTVAFADLVSFTALSNDMDQDRIGNLVEIFESRCSDVIAAKGGRLIKTLGDSVLFVAEEPAQAMRIALGIIEVIGDDPRLPDVRLGLASGMVVTRLGDVFGPPVNLAARLTAVARRNRVITDQATAARLPPDRFAFRTLTARPLRGFGLVEPVAVRRH